MIVLLTDFGFSEYVGVMKGVIYRIHEDAKIVDLCHDISPQCVIEASWILKSNYTYFPIGAVFCCVVDPGVGTERKALVGGKQKKGRRKVQSQSVGRIHPSRKRARQYRRRSGKSIFP